MNDPRLLRRYLSLVRRAEDVLDECEAAAATAAPVPAEAADLLENLVDALAPVASGLQPSAPDPEEVRRQLAGWIH